MSAAYFPSSSSPFSFYVKHRLDIQYAYYVFSKAAAKKVHDLWEYDTVCCHDGEEGYYDREYDPWIGKEYAAVLKRFNEGDRIYVGDSNYLWLLENAERFLKAFQPTCVHCHKARNDKDADPDHLQCEMKALVALGWKTHSWAHPD
jgi:hypothetical protein